MPQAQGSAHAPLTQACDNGQSEFALQPTGIIDLSDAEKLRHSYFVSLRYKMFKNVLHVFSKSLYCY